MKNFRNIVLKSLVLLAFVVTACTVYAQEKNDAQKIADKLKTDDKVAYDPKFVEETNKLLADENLYTISTEDTHVLVAALVCNTTSNKDGRGDYSTYWKNNNKTAPNRYTWVFIPEDFIKKCEEKGILSITNTNERSKRLCKLLGLDHTVQRDTIIYMRVPKKSLFRPAYNPSIYDKVEKNCIDEINNKLPKADVKWMHLQQLTNDYPWTRMGYTYDYGSDNKNKNSYIGVAEFVIRPGTKIEDSGFITIGEIDKNNGLWPGKNE